MLSRNLSIGHRIILGFAVPCLLLVVIGYFSLRDLDSVQSGRKWVDHTIEVLTQVHRFDGAVQRLESDGRLYLLTGDRAFRTDLGARSGAAAAALQQIQTLTLDNPREQARVEQVTPLLADRIQFSRDLAALRDQGADTRSPGVAASIEQGQRLSDSVRQVIDGMNQEETQLLRQREEETLRSMNFTRFTVFYGTIVAFLMIAVGGFFLTRSITGPLELLRRSAARIGEGDYGHRVLIDREDESGQLGRVFNAMAAQVQERQAALASQDWLKSNLARLADMFERQRDPIAVCHSLLDDLARLIHAQQGVIYRVSAADGTEALERCATHAANHAPLRLLAHEGLAGQCLASQRRIHLENAPPDYLLISSALGAGRPTSVLVEPVRFEGRMKAVMELASFEPFTELELQLVARLAESLGVVLNTIETVLRTEQLLREAQTLNHELQLRTERLRKSEMLLQDQQAELTQANEELEQTNEELQQSNEEMEEKSNLLASQKRDLEESNRQIEQARASLQEQTRQLAVTSKYKSDFLASMSHELRTPLNSLLILARILGENRDGNLSDKQQQYAKTIESSGADLLEMINQILDLAKIESGTVELQLDDFPVAEIQQSLDRQFRHIAEVKRLGFEVAVAPGMPATVRTDPRRLGQVLKNLLSNAFKFTEAGSIRVELRPASEGWKGGHPGLDQAPAVVAIAVTDTGIGIPLEQQQLVFESFRQAEAGISRRFGGTGLGLSISRELATLLGGVLQLESAPGRGSTFTLFIPATLTLPPAAKPAPAAPPAAAPAAAPAAGGVGRAEPDGSVLIVEDDATQREAIRELIGRDDAMTTLVGSGTEALAALDRQRFNCIILDLVLPDRPGTELIREINRRLGPQVPPIIVYTGKELTPQEETELRALSDSIIVKNARSPERLLEETALFLHRVRATRPEAQRPKAERVRSTDAALAGRRIFIVDDDVRNVFALTAALEGYGMQVDFAESGQAAVEKLQAGPKTDVVLMDVMLPGMDGNETIRRLRADGRFAQTPIISVTAKAMKGDRERCIEAGASDYITKPVDVERLLSLLRVWLYR